MRRVLTAGHGRTGAVRALALLGVAAALAGCNHDREVVAAAYPTDLRHRHPITISEGVRTVELFVGTSRGSLTPKQRADVAGFAHNWGHESTGGIVIDVPSGTSNGHAASDVLPEIRSILAANGVPPDVIAARPYRPVDPMKLALDSTRSTGYAAGNVGPNHPRIIRPVTTSATTIPMATRRLARLSIVTRCWSSARRPRA